MREIQLTQGYVALIDDEDYERVNYFKWHVFKRKTNKYAQAQACRVNGKNKIISLHEIILPNIPIGYERDHIDGNGLNCQKSNLRVVTHIQNMQNKKHIDNKTSKYKGVCRTKGEKRYRCAICVNKKVIYIGKFDCEIDAAMAYNEMAKKHFGEHAALNIF